MKLYYGLFALLILFSECSSKDFNNPNITSYTQTVDEIEDNEMFDEFEDDTNVEEISDPFSGYNRFMTSFNDGLYENFLTPIIEGYNFIFHEEIRVGISNMFKNLYYPPRVINNIFQGKLLNAGEETARFTINSTIGILGFFDPAKSYFGLKEHEEDFGQTLGFYGVGAGPHIVLPLWGPSNLRDTISIFPDSYFSFIDYTPREWYTITNSWGEFLGVKAYEQVNKFSIYQKEYENLKKNSVDLYPYLRDIYEQHRDKQIKE